MKQQINTQQLSQLSDNGKKKLIEWKIKHDKKQITKDQIEATTLTEIGMLEGSLMSQIGNGKWLCLNIGQMIEFLGDDWIDYIEYTLNILNDELCDALWSECVEILNGE